MRRTPPADHGTQRRYTRGCRCARCRKAWRDYMTARRRVRGQADRAVAARRADVRRTQAIVVRAVEAQRDPVLPVELSRLGGQILVAIQQSTGRSRRTVIDDLLRQHGGDVPVRESQR